LAEASASGAMRHRRMLKVTCRYFPTFVAVAVGAAVSLAGKALMFKALLRLSKKWCSVLFVQSQNCERAKGIDFVPNKLVFLYA
jgi:hypothetical protein